MASKLGPSLPVCVSPLLFSGTLQVSSLQIMEGNCLELLFSSSEQPIWLSGFRPSNLGNQSIEQYQVPGTRCFLLNAFSSQLLKPDRRFQEMVKDKFG